MFQQVNKQHNYIVPSRFYLVPTQPAGTMVNEVEFHHSDYNS